mmetsp:Transcript_25550/g.36649  ORF Transcript_25550/g.36649 Transcript_25550/m.36649 type:complete len:704 (-) Transcript_25550:51-2162(-)
MLPSSSDIPDLSTDDFKSAAYEVVSDYRTKSTSGFQVLPAESHTGAVEYKRKIYKPSPSRLRTLATQMNYRMDEGKGVAIYEIGVEDDGTHSLLDYETIQESVTVIETLARSLNAIVLDKVYYQNEQQQDKNRVAVSTVTGQSCAADDELNLSVLDDERVEDKKEDKSDFVQIQNGDGLDKTMGIATRCTMTIQRVETHLLDPSPSSLTDIANSANSDFFATATEKATSGDSVLPSTKGNNLYHSSSSSVSDTLSKRNIRIAVVGNVDAGKSSLIGTLVTSSLDDGRGKSRISIMKHRHEIESGRTSTATTHLLGFRSTGEAIGGKDQVRANKPKSEDEIARESYRIVTLMDLAGHEKYLKTTIHGVSSGFADYALILVNSRHPPTHMTQHHLNLCCSFGIPLIVVMTKIDGCPEHALKISKLEICRLLRSPDVGKRPFAVRTQQDVETCMDKMHCLAPIIETSCVTGEGLDLLQTMLFSLPKRRHHEKKLDRPFEFLVEDIFNVPGVGSVVSGFVNAGELTVGGKAEVFVGPTDDGTFIKTIAKSAHIARINTTHVTAGQSACLALSLNKDLRKKLRRGMVVLRENATSTKFFDAEICVLKGEGTTIRRSYQAFVHILNVRQSAYARHIELVKNVALVLPGRHHNDAEEGIVLRPGSRAKVRFEFAKRPEYIRPGMRMIFRDGRVRGVGIITAIPTTFTVVN